MLVAYEKNGNVFGVYRKVGDKWEQIVLEEKKPEWSDCSPAIQNYVEECSKGALVELPSGMLMINLKEAVKL